MATNKYWCFFFVWTSLRNNMCKASVKAFCNKFALLTNSSLNSYSKHFFKIRKIKLERQRKLKNIYWAEELRPNFARNIVIVNYGIELSYLPANLCSLAGRHDNPMPESTISPSQGLRIWLLHSRELSTVNSEYRAHYCTIPVGVEESKRDGVAVRGPLSKLRSLPH